MKFEVLLQRVPDDGLFTTGHILSGVGQPEDLRRQLARWVSAGKVLQLRRGVYMLSAPYARRAAHPFLVANTLHRASYVSLQSALSHYGMIPEYVPVTTSVTTGRPEEVSTSAGRYQFRHLAKSRFFGFREIELAPGQRALVATPCKALVDLLYLAHHSDNPGYLRELRIARPPDLDIEKLFRTAELTGSAKVLRAVRCLVTVWEEFR
jgi:predicted transcriptional regulator of viral defense system